MSYSGAYSRYSSPGGSPAHRTNIRFQQGGALGRSREGATPAQGGPETNPAAGSYEDDPPSSSGGAWAEREGSASRPRHKRRSSSGSEDDERPASRVRLC